MKKILLIILLIAAIGGGTFLYVSKRVNTDIKDFYFPSKNSSPDTSWFAGDITLLKTLNAYQDYIEMIEYRLFLNAEGEGTFEAEGYQTSFSYIVKAVPYPNGNSTTSVNIVYLGLNEKGTNAFPESIKKNTTLFGLDITNGKYVYRLVDDGYSSEVKNGEIWEHSDSVYSRENKTDPSCDGDKNQEIYAGFGIEHTYKGEISPGKKVTAVLSCDHKKFTITGAVDQVITSASISNPGEEQSELADLLSGSLVVDFDSDYNFDGYKDLSSIFSNGSGPAQIDSYIIFLYDPAINKFVFNKALSGLENISVDETEKSTLKQSYSYGWGYGGKEIYWQWKGGKLVKTGEKTIEAER